MKKKVVLIFLTVFFGCSAAACSGNSDMTAENTKSETEVINKVGEPNTEDNVEIQSTESTTADLENNVVNKVGSSTKEITIDSENLEAVKTVFESYISRLNNAGSDEAESIGKELTGLKSSDSVSGFKTLYDNAETENEQSYIFSIALILSEVSTIKMSDAFCRELHGSTMMSAKYENSVEKARTVFDMTDLDSVSELSSEIIDDMLDAVDTYERTYG